VILASFDRWLRRGRPASVDPAPAAPPKAKAPIELVIDLDPTGKVSANGNSLDDAQLDTLFTGAGRPTDVIIRYGKKTPAEARNAIIERAQAAGCRVSFVRI
jgi:hypothetical protein